MPTADQEAIQQTVCAFLEKELPMERVRRLGPAGSAALAPLWAAAAELGFFGLGVAEPSGGSGYALTEEMILFEELGRVLAPGPWLGTVLAAHVLADADGPSWRARLLRGELPVALIDRPAEAGRRLDGDRVSGTWSAVLDALGAGALLLAGDDGEPLFVPCDQAEVEIEARPSLDPTRSLARVSLRRARAHRLGGNPGAASLRRQGTALACAEAVGGIQRTVEMSVEYGKVRVQFERPIGSFQAVKHRCADMAVRAEVARSATVYATVAVRDGAADADFQVSVAKALCANAYVQNAADNVQNHGGMGFTWECDAHLFVKRARAFDHTFGDRTTHLDRIAATFNP